MKIYEMNSWDWVCANNEDEALDVYKKHLADSVGENSTDYEEILKDTDPVELTDKQLDNMKFSDDDCQNYTFREELARRTKPEFFASTEF